MAVLKNTSKREYRPEQGIGNAFDREKQAEEARLAATRQLGGDMEDVTPSTQLPDVDDFEADDDFEVERKVGWVDINTVFPMGHGLFNATEDEKRKQPRTKFNRGELDDLKADLKENSQLTPAWVRRVAFPSASGQKRYNIIDGERRWLMMKELGETRFLVRILNADTRKAYRLAVLADIHNVAHSSVDRGRAITQLKADMEYELSEFLKSIRYDNAKVMDGARLHGMEDKLKGCPQWIVKVMERAAKTKRRPDLSWKEMEPVVGLSERAMRDYETQAGLEPEIVEALQEGKISARHGSALTMLPTSTERKKLFRKIQKEGLNSVDTRKEAQAIVAKASPVVPKVVTPSALPELQNLVAQAQRVAGLDVPENEREQGRVLVVELGLLLGQLEGKWG